MKNKLLFQTALLLTASLVLEIQQVSAEEAILVTETQLSAVDIETEEPIPNLETTISTDQIQSGEISQLTKIESEETIEGASINGLETSNQEVQPKQVDPDLKESVTYGESQSSTSLTGSKGVAPINQENSDAPLMSSTDISTENITRENNVVTKEFNLVHGERLEGRSRDEVAAEVSHRGWEKSDLVFITNGYKENDALAAASLAGAYEAPILFTRDTYLPQATADEIKQLETKRVVMIGGSSSIPQEILLEVENLGVEVERIDGKNRYALASNIAEQVRQVNQSTSSAFLVNGAAYADAVSVAPIAAAKGIPIYLTGANFLHEEVKPAIDKVDSWYIVGGKNSISDEVIQDLTNLGGLIAERFTGANRYDVNRRINQYFKVNQDMTFIASGEKYADALAIAPLAGRDNRGVLLVKNKNRYEIPLQVKFVEDYDFKELVFVGGTNTISNDSQLEVMGHNQFAKLDRILTSTSGHYIKPFTSVNNPVITKEMVTDRVAIGVADPFIVKNNDRYHLFFEVLTKNGDEIGHAYSDDLIKWTYTQIVINNSIHRAAYPNIFKVDGEWYLIPDSAGSGNVHLYHAADFPLKWNHETILVDTTSTTTKTIVDTNVFEYQGNWYMTTTGGMDGWNKGLALYINTSGDWKNDKWRKHPSNIIIPTNAEYSGVRGAGNPMIFDDYVFLPIQVSPKSTGIYGEKTYLFSLTNLSPTKVTVKNLGLLVQGQKNGAWNSKAMHHVSYAPYIDQNIYAVDGLDNKDEYTIGLYQNV